MKPINEIKESDFTEADFKKLASGKPATISHTDGVPSGDNVINAVRSAIWDAWEMGLEQGGNSHYPSLPLLDEKPMEPEI